MCFKVRVDPLRPLSKSSVCLKVLSLISIPLKTVFEPDLGEFILKTPSGILKHGLESEFGIFGIGIYQHPDISVELLGLVRGQDESQRNPSPAVHHLDSAEVEELALRQKTVKQAVG